MFSGDVTSRACFESSYTKGEEIFWRLGALQKAMSKKKYSVIPGYQDFSHITSRPRSYQLVSKKTYQFYDTSQIYPYQELQGCMGT